MALRKRNGKWLATVFRGYEPQQSGPAKRLEHSRTFELRKDAERWLREQRGDLERGAWVAPTAMTLRQWLDQWEAGALRVGPQRERTKESYRELLRLYVRPHISALKL